MQASSRVCRYQITQRLADKFLALPGRIDIGRVDQIDARLQRHVDRIAHPAGQVADIAIPDRDQNVALLDHHFLDEVEGLGIPTLENLCAFIAAKMQSYGLKLSRVSVWRESLGDRCDLRL